MKQRPFGIWLSASLFFTIPIHSVFQAKPISLALIFFDWFIPILLSIGLVRVNLASWYLLFIFLTLQGFRELYSQLNLQGFPPGVFVGNILGYVMTVFYYINPRIQRLYFDHRLQWWKNDKRVNVEIPVTVLNHQLLKGKITDINSRGCFLQIEKVLSKFEIQEMMLQIPERSVSARGVIRWENSDGYGLEYIGNRSHLIRELTCYFL